MIVAQESQLVFTNFQMTSRLHSFPLYFSAYDLLIFLYTILSVSESLITLYAKIDIYVYIEGFLKEKSCRQRS